MTPRKTSSEISALVISQLETALSTSIPLLPKAFLRILAKVIGGIFVLLYEYIGFVLLQLFVKTATDDEISVGTRKIRPLSAWGELVGIYRGAGQATDLEIEITVLSQGGTLVSGTTLINTATQKTYQILGNVSLNSATKTAVVRCTEYGEIGNVDDDSTLNFVSPPASVEKTVTVTDTDTEGVDEELVEDFRERIIARWAARPQGGAYADYFDWCRAVPGVKNAYPYSGWDHPAIVDSRSGCVIIFIESETDTDGIPPVGGALLQAVNAAINQAEDGLANRRPINAYTDVSFCRPISRVTVNVTISGLTDLNADQKAATMASTEEGLSQYLLDREPYITGLNVMPRKDVLSLPALGGIAMDIAGSNGGYFTVMTATVNGSSLTAPYTFQEGEKSKLGTLTWA
jgi:uncharacterized phage protein gp47/JayE